MQNEETFFRQFIAGFVAIWEEQLQLKDWDTSVLPHPSQVKHDLGPHIKRLPEELIPAIQKFLIIAKSSCLERVFLYDLFVSHLIGGFLFIGRVAGA